MKIELKPCPFCGVSPKREVWVSHWSGYVYHFINCDNVKCLIRPTKDYYETKGSATRAWNRRANNG